ncbi:MAG TPA: metallophosphoesterase family protein [Solirubrobacteraceae bacterium]|jgi:predicted phosphodiesterase|nr:metallophosphoesterase family protein [Solirubrobacteraceae bacterium]
MNVLALYDIHGNVDALDAVLDDPRSAGADVVVVGGDTVPGPFARASLDRLRSLDAPLRWVRGNGEREVAATARGAAGGLEGMVALTAARTAEELGDDALGLGDLPVSVRVDQVLFCHASPRRDDEMLTRISPAGRWEETLSGTGARLVVAGHTHQPDDRIVGGTRFVNAGSVGMPYDGTGEASWLWIADGEPELRRTRYDAVGVGTRILAGGWPDTRSITASLIDPVDPDTITRLFEEISLRSG